MEGFADNPNMGADIPATRGPLPEGAPETPPARVPLAEGEHEVVPIRVHRPEGVPETPPLRVPITDGEHEVVPIRVLLPEDVPEVPPIRVPLPEGALDIPEAHEQVLRYEAGLYLDRLLRPLARVSGAIDRALASRLWRLREQCDYKRLGCARFADYAREARR